MIQWNLESFKETHPRLFKSIISAMMEVSKPNNDRIKELSEGVKIGLEAISELHEFQDGWENEERQLYRMINGNPKTLEDCAEMIRSRFSFDRVFINDDCIIIEEEWSGECKNDDDCFDEASAHGEMVIEEMPELEVAYTDCHRHKYSVTALKIKNEKI